MSSVLHDKFGIGRIFRRFLLTRFARVQDKEMLSYLFVSVRATSLDLPSIFKISFFLCTRTYVSNSSLQCSFVINIWFCDYCGKHFSRNTICV